MNRMKKVFAIILCAFMVSNIAACTQGTDNNADIGGSSSIVSSEPKGVRSEVSRESSVVPESSLPESSASEISEEPSGVTDPTSGDGVKLETLTVGSAEFQKLFVKNVIDEKFNAEFDLATSNAMLGDIIYDATESWKQMVSVSYDAALESSETDERREEVKNLYNTYLNTMQSGLTHAKTLSESDAIAGALATMNHYRTCAAQLCNLKFENDQTLPSFDLTDVSGAAAG